MRIPLKCTRARCDRIPMHRAGLWPGPMLVCGAGLRQIETTLLPDHALVMMTE